MTRLCSCINKKKDLYVYPHTGLFYSTDVESSGATLRMRIGSLHSETTDWIIITSIVYMASRTHQEAMIIHETHLPPPNHTLFDFVYRLTS